MGQVFFCKFFHGGNMYFFPSRTKSDEGGTWKKILTEAPKPPKLNLRNFWCFKHEMQLFKVVSSIKVVKIYTKYTKIVKIFGDKCRFKGTGSGRKMRMSARWRRLTKFLPTEGTPGPHQEKLYGDKECESLIQIFANYTYNTGNTLS